MNKFEIAKKAATFVVGLGTGTVTGGIIKNNVVPKNNLEKVVLYLRHGDHSQGDE